MTTLLADAQGVYVRLLTTGLARARLSGFHPEPRAVASHLSAMSPDSHQGLYPTLELDPRSGLPTFKEWSRVVTDQELASSILAELPARQVLAARVTDDAAQIRTKQLRTYDYHAQLLQLIPAPLDRIVISLVRSDPERREATFSIVFDKLDVTGLLTRYTIELRQQHQAWARRLVRLTADTASHTSALRALVYRCASLDAELTLLHLAAVRGITVERVVKGTWGPVAVGGIIAPRLFPPALQPSDGLVMTAGLDMAGIDLPGDRDNDPLTDLFADELSHKARDAYREGRSAYGYRVFKDRKFVVSPALRQAVTTWCAAAGTTTIVYTVDA